MMDIHGYLPPMVEAIRNEMLERVRQRNAPGLERWDGLTAAIEAEQVIPTPAGDFALILTFRFPPT